MYYVNIHISFTLNLALTKKKNPVGDGEKLPTYLNWALKVLSGLDIFPHVPKKKVKLCCPLLLITLLYNDLGSMHGCYVKGVFNGTLCWQAIADKKLIKTVRGFEIIWAVLLMNLSTPMMEEPRSSDTQADLSFHSHRKPAVISTTKDADTVSTTRN